MKISNQGAEIATQTAISSANLAAILAGARSVANAAERTALLSSVADGFTVLQFDTGIYWRREAGAWASKGTLAGGSGAGLIAYASKSAANRALYGQPATGPFTVAGALYLWTGTQLQAYSLATADPAPLPAPPQPTLTLTPGNGQVNVAWTRVNAPYNTQVLTRTVNLITTQPSITAAAASYLDTGLTNGLLASYSLVQSNDLGDSPAGTASATPVAGAATNPYLDMLADPTIFLPGAAFTGNPYLAELADPTIAVPAPAFPGNPYLAALNA